MERYLFRPKYAPTARRGRLANPGAPVQFLELLLGIDFAERHVTIFDLALLPESL
jgi:hypothetical protein